MATSSIFWVTSTAELYHASYVSSKAGGTGAPLVLTAGGAPVSVTSLVLEEGRLSATASSSAPTNAATLVHHWEGVVALDVAVGQCTLTVREVPGSASAPALALKSVGAALTVSTV